MYVFNESEIMEYESQNANGFLLADISIAMKKYKGNKEMLETTFSSCKVYFQVNNYII